MPAHNPTKPTQTPSSRHKRITLSLQGSLSTPLSSPQIVQNGSYDDFSQSTTHVSSPFDPVTQAPTQDSSPIEKENQKVIVDVLENSSSKPFSTPPVSPQAEHLKSTPPVTPQADSTEHLKKSRLKLSTLSQSITGIQYLERSTRNSMVAPQIRNNRNSMVVPEIRNNRNSIVTPETRTSIYARIHTMEAITEANKNASQKVITDLTKQLENLKNILKTCYGVVPPLYHAGLPEDESEITGLTQEEISPEIRTIIDLKKQIEACLISLSNEHAKLIEKSEKVQRKFRKLQTEHNNTQKTVESVMDENGDLKKRLDVLQRKNDQLEQERKKPSFIPAPPSPTHLFRSSRAEDQIKLTQARIRNNAKEVRQSVDRLENILGKET